MFQFLVQILTMLDNGKMRQFLKKNALITHCIALGITSPDEASTLFLKAIKAKRSSNVQILSHSAH